MKYLRLAVILLFLISVGGVIYTMHTLSMRDVTPPIISAEYDEIHISVNDSQDILFDGLNAVDDRDGDILHCPLYLLRYSICRINHCPIKPIQYHCNALMRAITQPAE